MTRRPRITGREVVAALRKAGFDVARIKGSHHFLRHAADEFDLTPEQRAELDRRLAEHIADPALAIPWDEVRRKLLRGA